MMGDDDDRAAGAVLGVGNKSQLFPCHWAAEKRLLFPLFRSEPGFFFSPVGNVTKWPFCSSHMKYTLSLAYF